MTLGSPLYLLALLIVPAVIVLGFIVGAAALFGVALFAALRNS